MQTEQITIKELKRRYYSQMKIIMLLRLINMMQTKVIIMLKDNIAFTSIPVFQ